jgi:CheY-like chemotaxis protein
MLEDLIWSGAVSRVVLVVDDDLEVLEILAVILEDLGCEVVTATRPQEALEKLGADPRVEVLFTDIEMPEMDGYELAKQAQRVRSGLKVIVTSGRAQDRTDLPMVPKPFGSEAIARAMDDAAGLC